MVRGVSVAATGLDFEQKNEFNLRIGQICGGLERVREFTWEDGVSVWRSHVVDDANP